MTKTKAETKISRTKTLKTQEHQEQNVERDQNFNHEDQNQKLRLLMPISKLYKSRVLRFF